MADNAPMDVDAPSTKQPRFQVKKVRACVRRVARGLTLVQWNAVCLWSWDIVVDNVSAVVCGCGGAQADRITVCDLPQPHHGPV